MKVFQGHVFLLAKFGSSFISYVMWRMTDDWLDRTAKRERVICVRGGVGRMKNLGE